MLETNMETKELKITIPEGQEIDWQESVKQEKIVFKKKKDTKPRSWEEYCHNFKGELFFENNNDIDSVVIKNGMSNIAKNYVPSKKLAEAFLAMMQLMSIRDSWINDWEPDWSNEYLGKYCICGIHCDFGVCHLSQCRYPLSFPTKEMAIDFMNCFKDLLEIAKPLI